MALLRKALTPEDSEILKTGYDGLRAASEQLQSTNLDIYRLMSVKMLHAVDSDQANSLHAILKQHERAAFGDQDPSQLKRDQPNWYARNRGVVDSLEFIDQELERATASKAKVESAQAALRCCINRLSRPYLRSLNLLDLPDEILLEIFEHLEDRFLECIERYPHCYWTPSRDIKALRLTCRRICDISSQLLVRIVHLDFHPESVERLEEISRHPTISKGVHIVKVDLLFYNFSFCDIEHFLSFHVVEAEQQIDLYEKMEMWDFCGTSKDDALAMIANGNKLMSTLRRLLSGDRSQEDDQHWSRAVETHELYLKLMQMQASLIQSHKFYRAVGSAIARMPCARALVFDDSGRPLHRYGPKQLPGSLMVPGGDIWERLRGWILVPLNGFAAKSNHLEPPDYTCIIPLIDAVRDAGVFLRHLSFDLCSRGRSVDLVPSPDLRPSFSSGMQQLRTFSFTYAYESSLFVDHDDNSEHDDEDSDDSGDSDSEHVKEASGIQGFLSACLETSTLRLLELDFRSGVEHFPLRFGDILNRNKSLHKLNGIHIGKVDLDYADLMAFLRHLPKPMHFIRTRTLRLLNGSWREVLDVLREKQPRVVRFCDLGGGEFESMTKEQYDHAFKEERFGGDTTRAEAYIEGRLFPNPFQALEDATLVDEGSDADQASAIEVPIL